MTGAQAVVSLEPFRWWQVEPVLELERELFGADAWSAEMFWSELAQLDTHHYLVALAGDRLVGYAGVTAYAGEAYIQTLGVAAAAQRRGVGTALLTALLTRAEACGARTVGLEVRTDNAAALRLYARHGFAVVGTRRGYYQPSGGDAHVMLRETPR
jgi:ribosomal-protein-alanine N-acetyltransferase